VLESIQKAIPECLQAFFQGGKILPYHLPLFLRDIVKVQRLPNSDDVDLDIDVGLLFETVHNRALQAFDENQLPLAKLLLESLLKFNDRNPLVLYNLACAESLLGNCDRAVQLLTLAVEYKQEPKFLSQIEQDADFNNIREHPGFIEILQNLRAKQATTQETVVNPSVDVAPESIQTENSIEEPKPEEIVDTKVEVANEANETPVISVSAEVAPNQVQGITQNDNVTRETSSTAQSCNPYAVQLAQLKEMGLRNEVYNLHLLTRYAGNLDNVINEIFNLN